MEALSVLNQLSSQWVRFAGLMLVQSSILIVALLGIDWLIRRKVRAVVRYGIWMLVLVKLVLPVGLALPCSPAYWIGAFLPQAETKPLSESLVVQAETNVVTPATESPKVVAVDAPPVDRHTESRLVESPVAPALSTTPPVSEALTPLSPEGVKISWILVAALIWLVTVLVMLGLLIQRALLVRGLVRQSQDVDEATHDQLDHCASALGVRQPVEMRISPNATSPSVCGLFRPVILIPDPLIEHLGPDQMRAIVMHELAHIKRGDLWVNLVQALLQILYFFHPLLWVANAAIRRVREQAVDEMVLVALQEEAEAYPETLLNVSKLVWKRPMLTLRLIGVVESKSALAERIRHMLAKPFPTSAKIGLAGLVVVLICSVVLLPMAIAKPSDSKIVAKAYWLVRPLTPGEKTMMATAERVLDDGVVGGLVKVVFDKSRKRNFDAWEYQGWGKYVLVASEKQHRSAAKALKREYGPLLVPEQQYDASHVRDIHSFSTNCGKILHNTLSLCDMPFLTDQDIDDLADDLGGYVNEYTRRDLPKEMQLRILETLHRSVLKHFGRSSITGQEAIYLEFDNQYKTLKLKLWQVIATDSLSEQEEATFVEQKQWIYDYIEETYSATSELERAKREYRITEVFEDVLNGFSQQPMPDAIFSELQQDIQQGTDLSDVVTAASCWSTEIAIYKYEQARRDSGGWQFPFGTVWSYSGGSDDVYFDFESEKPRVHHTVWLSEAPASKSYGHVYDIASKRTFKAPNECHTTHQLLSWIEEQSQGDILFDHSTNSLVCCRGARMAILDVNNWIDSDRVTTENLKAMIRENPVFRFNLSSYWNHGDTAFGSHQVAKPVVPLVAIASKEGAIALIRANRLKHPRRGDAYLTFRHRTEGWRKQWYSTFLTGDCNESIGKRHLAIEPLKMISPSPIPNYTTMLPTGDKPNPVIEVDVEEHKDWTLDVDQVEIDLLKSCYVEVSEYYSVPYYYENRPKDRQTIDQIKMKLEACLQQRPDFFYAEYMLADWHWKFGDRSLSRQYYERAYKHAPVILVQQFFDANGTPIVGHSVQHYEIACVHMAKNERGQPYTNVNVKFCYPYQKTDNKGCIYLPVYDSVYRLEAYFSGRSHKSMFNREGNVFFKSSSRLAVLPTVQVSEATPRPRQPETSYIAKLPNGATVELLGICEHPSTGKLWWQPDGSLLDEAPYQTMNDREAYSDLPLYEVVLRLKDPEKTICKIKSTDTVPGYFGLYPISRETEDVFAEAQGCFYGYIPIKGAMNHVDLSLSCGTESGWETLAPIEAPVDKGGINTGNSYLDVSVGQNKRIIAHATHQLADREVRIIAKDRKGGVHHPISTKGMGLHWANTLTAEFDISVDDAASVELQIQEFQTITFKNVSLKPGNKTEVEIQVGADTEVTNN